MMFLLVVVCSYAQATPIRPSGLLNLPFVTLPSERGEQTFITNVDSLLFNDQNIYRTGIHNDVYL